MASILNWRCKACCIVQGISAAVELPEELLQAVSALRSLSDKAAKAAKKADAPEMAAKHRAFAGILPHHALLCRMSNVSPFMSSPSQQGSMVRSQ